MYRMRAHDRVPMTPMTDDLNSSVHSNYGLDASTHSNVSMIGIVAAHQMQPVNYRKISFDAYHEVNHRNNMQDEVIDSLYQVQQPLRYTDYYSHSERLYEKSNKLRHTHSTLHLERKWNADRQYHNSADVTPLNSARRDESDDLSKKEPIVKESKVRIPVLDIRHHGKPAEEPTNEKEKKSEEGVKSKKKTKKHKQNKHGDSSKTVSSPNFPKSGSPTKSCYNMHVPVHSGPTTPLKLAYSPSAQATLELPLHELKKSLKLPSEAEIKLSRSISRDTSKDEQVEKKEDRGLISDNQPQPLTLVPTRFSDTSSYLMQKQIEQQNRQTSHNSRFEDVADDDNNNNNNNETGSSGSEEENSEEDDDDEGSVKEYEEDEAGSDLVTLNSESSSPSKSIRQRLYSFHWEEIHDKNAGDLFYSTYLPVRANHFFQSK
jgi:hypothetical protein